VENETMKNAGVFLAAVLCVSSTVFAALSGNGTQADPYLIQSRADFDEFANSANATTYWASGKYTRLMCDLNLSDITYTQAPIAPDTSDSAGYQGTVYAGHFDGNYHVISNLTIDTQGQGNDYLGLFGYIPNSISGEGIVKQLGLENVSITAGNYSEILGALAGMNEYIITNCYARGSITVGSDSHTIGGLVGGNGSQITNCYADVDIYTGLYAADIGGFCGKAYGLFAYCYAGGYVQGAAPVAGGFGGSTLYGNWFITNCYYLAPGDGGGPNNGIGTVLTDAQMRQQVNFVGWDFQGSAADGEKEVWQTNGGYPVLAWQVPVGMRQLVVLSRYWQMTGCVSGQPCVIADWYDDDVINITDLAFLAESWLGHGMKTDYPKTTDDFETGDFTALPWVHSGAANWTVISGSDVYAGTYSAKSGAIGNSQSSSLELTANVTGNSEIVFAVKVSSQSGDKLDFYIDGSVRLMDYSGEQGWNEISFSGFGNGPHTFKWSYSKDSGGSGGSDSVWIDNVRILRLEE
jgi:hypothetical protein